MPVLTDANLTDAIARRAKPKDKRYDIFDAHTRGMGLRVEKSGTKSWFVMRRVSGRMVRRTFGRYPALSLADARIEAKGLLAAMARGETEYRFKSRLCGTYLDEWIARDQAQNRSVRQVINAIDLFVRPTLARRKLEDITKSDINRIIDGIMNRGAGVQANRVLAYLKRFFGWCVSRDYVAANPTSGISKPYRETSRDRVLSLDELRRVVSAARSMGYPFGPLFQLLVFTGQRRDEVAEARWDEFDLAARRWTIPSSRAKNGSPHVVHLSDAVTQILQDVPVLDSQDYLFSTRGDRPVSGFSAAKKRLDRLSGVSGWTLHDLRRSYATHATEQLGISPVVVDKILNHQSGAVRGVAAVYQRGAYLEQRAEALDRWGAWLCNPNDKGCGGE